MTPLQNNENEPEELDLGTDYIGAPKLDDPSVLQRKAEERNSKKRKSTKIILIVALSLLGVFLALTIVIFALVMTGRNQMLLGEEAVITLPEAVTDVAPEDEGKTIVHNGKTYELNKNVTAILCMGVDRNELKEGETLGANGQSDANFLLTIDTVSGEVKAIAINRDTMVEMAAYSTSGKYLGTKRQQLCLSYAAGDGKEKSCENMMASVSNLFYGIPISAYIAIDLNAIGIMNEAVGNNITVTSPDSFHSSIYGVSFEAGKETILDSPAKAAAFVRQRDITKLDSNVTRMQRQKQYLQKFSAAAIKKTKESITFPITLYNLISDYNVNTMTIPKISYLTSRVVGGMKTPRVEFLSVEGKLKEAEVLQDGERKAEFHVDEQKLFELILDVFYDEVK